MLKTIFFMFLSNFIFAASHLKIHPNCSFKYFETLDIYSQQEKLIKKSTSFRYSYVITNVKKDKAVSFRAPGCTIRADKNSNVVALFTIIRIML